MDPESDDPHVGNAMAVTLPVRATRTVRGDEMSVSDTDPDQVRDSAGVQSGGSVLPMKSALIEYGDSMVPSPVVVKAMVSVSDVMMRTGWFALRRICGDLPAILITADRSPAVREQARGEGIQLLNKPVKPAAMRALLAQWRVLRVAAAE